MQKVSSLQSGLWSSLFERVISALETGEDGRILFNSANVLKVGRTAAVWATYRRQTGGVVDWLVKQLLKLFGLNTAYFREVATVSETTEERARKLLLKNLGYDLDTREVIKDSWLYNLAAQETVKQQVVNRLNAALQSRMPLKEFKTTFRNDFLDTKTGLGLVTKNMDFHTHNLFQSFDRASQLTYRDKLGLNWAIYSGTIMKPTKTTKGTRHFCLQRIGVVYGLAEIERWNELSWSGKIENSDVKITCGGYRCRHHLSYISDQMKGTLEKKGRPIDILLPLPEWATTKKK
jgi:hypothetical protein